MQTVLDLVGAHPLAASLLVALVALAESLAIVGTLVPAAIVMFSAGVLIGRGDLEPSSTLGLAALGAALGDALSYELGRRHQDRIRAWSVFQRHRAAVLHAEAFLRRHGGKSIVLARFTGAVRAFVPLLAGFSRMPRARFYGTNIVSALLWAPAHILPGVLFGTSLAMAEAVSGRLALVVLILVALIWTVTWVMSLLVRFGVPQARRLRDAAVARARSSNSRTARAALALLDPQQPGSHALLLGSIVVLGAGWLFFGILQDVLSRDPLVTLDVSVFRLLRTLRSAPGDRLMVAITEMGSGGVLVPLIALVLLWLAWRRCWRTAGYWLAVVVFGQVLVQVLKFTVARHRPVANIYGGTALFSFPSGHATASTVVLAFLAFLLSRGQTWRMRIVIAATTGAYVALVAFSRLYLGAHWLSDVLAGMSLGLAWVAFATMVYTRRGIHEDFAPRALIPSVAAAVVVFGALWIHHRAGDDAQRFAAASPHDFMLRSAWLADGWRRLPARRLEVTGQPQEPFQLQLACSRREMADQLAASGWQQAPAWSVTGVLGLLAPGQPIADLPVLPGFNLGEPSVLAFVRRPPRQPQQRDVLRLWRSEFVLAAARSHPAIWYGSVYREARGGRGYFTRNLIRQTVLPVKT
ncbi:MAG TPA: phosphatase PAP2 family protein, partial [Ramlibacter sp.]|nr:phosphatase PAP2 family protein [Ramlibacter sp.]